MSPPIPINCACASKSKPFATICCGFPCRFPVPPMSGLRLASSYTAASWIDAWLRQYKNCAIFSGPFSTSIQRMTSTGDLYVLQSKAGMINLNYEPAGLWSPLFALFQTAINLIRWRVRFGGVCVCDEPSLFIFGHICTVVRVERWLIAFIKLSVGEFAFFNGQHIQKRRNSSLFYGLTISPV